MEYPTILAERFGPRFRTQEPMHVHTNFRIGGPAQYYVEARSVDEVRATIAFATQQRIPWVVFGGGSNTLVADAGFPGIVIQLANREVTISGTQVTAGAGAITAAVARQAGEAGLTGYEWAVSLPGTIGGAVRGNAGCFGGETKDVVREVQVLRCSRAGEWQIDVLPAADCGFRYRHSIFKEQSEWVIVAAVLALAPGDAAQSRQRMADYLARRKAKQPLERPSAGCLFTNVELHRLTEAQCAQLDAATGGTWRAVAHDGQLPTGWIVEQSGCKGLRVGDAMISEKHGNFVVNLGHATAADVMTLSDLVRERVRAAWGIDLHEEVQRLGDGASAH
ncbi:UDP-N-acetylmuramate dehydrogenase [Candidatus Uhrbacteria bacterium]|nr:UDP-N-acetylmuramate dehydrogenase [Candidatus Uhrbacteria bacterium]